MRTMRCLFLGVLLLSSLALAACGSQPAPDDSVAATYKDQVILKERVALQKESMAGEHSDREVVDYLVTEMIFREEAERLGLAATEEEIETFLAETTYASYEMPEGKAMIDAYCAERGIPFEEYVEEVRAAAVGTIAKAKLSDQFCRDYCGDHGIPYDEMNPAQEARDALEDYKAELFRANQREITYYVS